MVDPPQRVRGKNKRPGADVETGGSDKPASSPTNGENGAPETARSGGSGGGGGGGGALTLIRNILIVLVVVGIIVLIVFLLRDPDDSEDPPFGIGNQGGVGQGLTPILPGQVQEQGESRTIIEIRQRQIFRCGVPNEYVGFGATNATTNQYEGFDVDLCRAVAVAIFGVDGLVEYVPLDSFNRFTSLQSGFVDMLARVTTHTMERDVYEENARAGFSFSTPYLYNGLTFAGDPTYVSCADNMTIGMLVDDRLCDDTRICVVGGTTTRDALFEANPRANLVERSSIADVYTGLTSNFCNVIAGEQMVVAESVLRSEGYLGRYGVGRLVHSKDPLALVTRDDDPVFADFVNWVMSALIIAEEEGVSQRGLTNSQGGNRLKETSLFGEDYRQMFRNIIRTVGNYGEIYQRNLELILPRPVPDLINNGNSALIYAFPFGSLANTPGMFPGGSSTSLNTMNNNGLTSGGRIQRIMNQGSLRCGITINREKPSDLFAKISQQPYSGFDVDFCQAVTAAIFNGDPSRVQYVLLDEEDAFKALATNQVDILSRASAEYEKDVKDRDTGVGYSFAQPHFYGGMAVGGIPPYGECADNEDHRSGQCVDLKICVRRGTKGQFLDILRNEIFPQPFIQPIDNSRDLGDALSDRGLGCNAVAGTIEEVSVSSMRRNYAGAYEVGVNRFSKDPQAMVTPQDDIQFSDFVYWVVSALFYADEEGITQFTSNMMPSVQLFGSSHVFMLRHAVAAVGSYGEIYNRHFLQEAPRGGPHASNKFLEGAQLYPLPGIVNE